MRVVQCAEFGPLSDLRLVTVPSPPLRSDQVRVAVAAAGVNFVDALIVQGKYQIKPPTPFVPGSEVVGVVAEVGDDVVDHYVNAADVELAAFNAAVTDWERVRGFERL